MKEKLYESYNQGDKDFTALVSKLKLNNIDIVYDGGYHQEAGLIVRQMRDQGLQDHPDGRRRAGRPASSPRSPARPAKACCSPSARSAQAADRRGDREKFKDKGIDPEGYTLYTYAAFQVWAQAATKAGTTDPQESRRRHARRHLGHGARPDRPSTRRATSPRSAGRSIAGTKTAITTKYRPAKSPVEFWT